MMNKDDILAVKNRSSANVIYTLEEDNIFRSFEPGEVKRLPYWEMEKLNNKPGGDVIIQDYLQITAEPALEQLNVEVEPEYYMSEKEIVDLLQFGSLDKFLDCLDFAPNGVIQLIKKFAVELPLNDVAKRQAILDKTGFNVTAAIMHMEESKAAENEPETKQQRRVAVDSPSAEPAAPVRRAPAETKYKVIHIDEENK